MPDDQTLRLLSDGLLRIENKVDKLSDAMNKLAQVEAQQSVFLDSQRRAYNQIEQLEQRIAANAQRTADAFIDVDKRIDALNKFRWQAAGVVGVVTFIGTLIGGDLVRAAFTVWLK